ncbi:MAG: right-handed parallel beta-helix repeat-containing protein [Acidobacteria bacterium]|nr:right-handed parallel beta-helix repeat-containing protein [Acidobacteriota bacterium]
MHKTHRPGRIATAIVVMAAVFVPVNAAAPSAHAASTTYLDEGYDAPPSTWGTDWFDSDIGSRNRISTISDGIEGSGIRVTIPTGSHFGSAMRWEFAANGETEPDELFYRYWLRFPDGFTNYGQGKLPGPSGLYSSSGRNKIRPGDANPGWSARMMFTAPDADRAGTHTQIGFYVYHRGQPGSSGETEPWHDSPGVLEHSRWYCVEGRVVMNTPGVANGVLEGWVDEKLAYYDDRFTFRGSADSGINVREFWSDVYYGGTATAPGTMSFDFDELVLSDQRVGCGGRGSGFRDTSDSVHETNIDKLAFAGITKGCNPPDNSRFCPKDSVTRGQMAAFLDRALNLEPTTIDFFDDDSDSIFEANINRLAASGITRGCRDRTYCPERPVTRGEMAAFLARGLSLPSGGVDLFTDDDDSIFAGSIDRLASAGITAGCNPPANDQFCPDDFVTRGQMASFLSRALALADPPPPPPGYTAPTVPNGYDAVVPLGWSIQSVIDQQPPGATILVRSGTYLRQEIRPKAGQTIDGEPGAKLDGMWDYSYAFTDIDNPVNGVTISGFEVTRYNSVAGTGAIHGAGDNWTVSNCIVHDNKYAGVTVSDGGTISDCTIYDHGYDAILITNVSNVTIANNEIYQNGDRSKFYGAVRLQNTTNVVISGNNIHDNDARGIWGDLDNLNTVYSQNTITNNWRGAIYHKFSYDVTIKDNVLTSNATQQPDTILNAAIVVRGPNATIFGNTVQYNRNGIIIYGQGLDSTYGKYGVLTATGASVDNNAVTDSGKSGTTTNGTNISIGVFDDNNYVYPDASTDWFVYLSGSGRTWAEWQAEGSDPNGTFTVSP